MKNTKLLLALLSTSTISGIIIPPDIEPVLIVPHVYSDGVLSHFTRHDQFLYLYFNENVIPTYKFRMQFLDVDTDELLFDKLVAYSELSSGTFPKAYDFLMPFEEYFSSKGLKISLTHYCPHNLTASSSVVIYPSKKEEVNVSAYRKSPYVREGVYLSVVDAYLQSKEEFDFSDLNEYIAIERNNKLDLSNIKFKYLCPHDFSSEDIYLKIRDFNNVFPNLKNDSGEVSLKMKPIQENNQITLVLEDKLYVNTQTYEMSLEEKDNFVETDTLFIPNGKEQLLTDNEVYISIKNAGFSETDFMIPFAFSFANKYVGECYESDYCITGGVKQWFILWFLQ